jgi:cytochrome c-type biogenesis protein CcmH/NrfF
MTNQSKRFLWLLISALILAALIPGSAMAQDSYPTEDDVNEVAKQLYCPVCDTATGFWLNPLGAGLIWWFTLCPC